MKLGISENSNENYLAKVVELGEPIKHPNADKLQGWNIDGNIVWTDMSRSTRNICVFFPIESALNVDLLKGLNLYQDAELNSNPEVKGFFNKHGRVRAINLRGEPSMGFLLTIDEISSVLGAPGRYVVDESFDTWNGQIICKKYVPKSGTPSEKVDRTTRNGRRVAKISKMVPGQFRLHHDTPQLRNNLHKIDPNDNISITYKLHGTSSVTGYVLVKRSLKWWEKALVKWGLLAKEQLEYDYIYSSRTRIKNEYHDNKQGGHWFGYDLWADVKDVLAPSIEHGITVYSEVVGHQRGGKLIQKGYDYGFIKPEGEECVEGIHYGIYIYRITSTNYNGDVIELSWPQVKEYCNKHNLKHVPELYYGKAKDWHEGVGPVDQHWHANLLDRLQETYLEQPCTMCTNKVAGEGIVVRVDHLNYIDAFKLKSFKFLQHETKMLDEEEVDIETLQTEEV